MQDFELQTLEEEYFQYHWTEPHSWLTHIIHIKWAIETPPVSIRWCIGVSTFQPYYTRGPIGKDAFLKIKWIREGIHSVFGLWHYLMPEWMMEVPILALLGQCIAQSRVFDTVIFQSLFAVGFYSSECPLKLCNCYWMMVWLWVGMFM